jgi:chemotaxis response regulator CheB
MFEVDQRQPDQSEPSESQEVQKASESVAPESLDTTSDEALDGGLAGVVGIGASAGGLESLERFFSQVPRNTGLAFVVVQHLSPDFKSLIDELLARRTDIPICQAEHEAAVQPDTIYLLPPRKQMIIRGGRL